MTGIYPFDWYALRPQDDKQKKSIAEKNSLKNSSRCSPRNLAGAVAIQKHWCSQKRRYNSVRSTWRRAMTCKKKGMTYGNICIIQPRPVLPHHLLWSLLVLPNILLPHRYHLWDLTSQKRRKRVRMTPTARKGMRQVFNIHSSKKVSYTTDSSCTVLWIACFLVVESYEDAVRSWTCALGHRSLSC